MKGKKISDNYSNKEMEFNLQGMKALKPLLAFLDKEKLKELEAMETKFKQLQETPDKFNQYFADRGWIAYETMNFEKMVEAVELAEKGNIEAGENILVEYYDEENLRFMISRLKGIEEFRPRVPIIYKALEDYLAERYHSSVPVVLMMIDGFVNDIEQKGFFATGIDLSIWDTIAAHDSGLNVLSKIFGASRKKTTVETIQVPYRNGILHGRDLGYDNKLVAAKAWAALIALGDWARAIKNGRNVDKKEFIPPTFNETISGLNEALNKYQQVQDEKKLIELWKPRDMTVNVNFPENGVEEDYEIGSPERTLVQFLSCLSQRNYGKLAQLTTRMFPSKETVGAQAGRMRKLFEGKNLKSFKILLVKDEASAITEIDAILSFEINGTIEDKEHKFRLIYQDEQCRPHVRGQVDGQWKIMLNFNGIYM